MNSHLRIILITVALVLLPALAFAQYTVVLKNGRRITTQSYREEGNTIKIYGLGGEVALPRDQVQTILQGEEGRSRGLDLRERSSGDDVSPSAPTPAPAATGKPSTENVPPPGDEKNQEESDYRKRVQLLTDELKAAQNNYFTAARGNASPEPSVITNDDGIRRRTDDLNARLRDAQQNPGGADGGPVRLESPSPFVGQPPAITEIPPGNVPPTVTPPPPGYTSREQELSELRNRMTELTKQREQVIEEMKQKNLETGNLFLQ
jgi:hypothetical protein